MLDSSKDLPKIRDLNQFEPDSVAEWMLSTDLGQFADIFVEAGFDTIDKVRKIKDHEIAAVSCAFIY